MAVLTPGLQQSVDTEVISILNKAFELPAIRGIWANVRPSSVPLSASCSLP